MAQDTPRFFMEDGTTREFTADDMECVSAAVANLRATGAMLTTTTADEAD